MNLQELRDSMPTPEPLICPGPIECRLRERLYRRLFGRYSPRVCAERDFKWDRAHLVREANLAAWWAAQKDENPQR